MLFSAPQRQQPQIYRAIIDDVIANVSVDFEEYGMDDDLLPKLQSVSLCHPVTVKAS